MNRPDVQAMINAKGDDVSKLVLAAEAWLRENPDDWAVRSAAGHLYTRESMVTAAKRKEEEAAAFAAQKEAARAGSKKEQGTKTKKLSVVRNSSGRVTRLAVDEWSVDGVNLADEEPETRKFRVERDGLGRITEITEEA